ncbi:hypothetical protein SAMN02745912_03138, partial [Paramaledivibacter caminithermalis DSM 15212]
MKEFQGRSYDCMIAHTTIVFTRYIMLSVENRKSADHRSIGRLCYLCCDELEDIKFFESISLILDLLKDALTEKLSLTKKQLNEFMNYIIASLPTVLKEKLAILC